MYRPADRIRRDGLQEILPARSLRAKTYATGIGKRKLVQSIGPIHYQEDDKSWQEIDLTPEDRGDHWRIERGLYRLTITKDAPGVIYDSRTGGGADVALESIGGASLAAVAPQMDGLIVTWADLAQDFDLELHFRPSGVHWVKVLKSAKAPREWAFSVKERGKETIAQPTGKDAKGRAAEVAAVSLAKTGGKIMTETFGGRASEIMDKKTRKRAFALAEYPVRIGRNA